MDFSVWQTQEVCDKGFSGMCYGTFGRWSDMEAAKLPEIILSAAILEKISINVVELLFSLVDCSICLRK